MIKFARLAALAAAATLVATPAFAAPVAADPKAKATAKIVKPLTLVATVGRKLDFGTIVVGTLAGPETVSVSQAGAITCGSSGNLTCSGTTQSAEYTVTGTKSVDVRVDTTGSNLQNTTSGGGELLAFAPTADFTMQLTNSGVPGTKFYIGGSIQIDNATVDGVYEGDIEVTVDYVY